MELNMSADEVLGHIVQLHNSGESLTKKCEEAASGLNEECFVLLS
ncbi:hypothetical protein [Paenibacillus hexagrammi]|nr:hypothetical protein [Paenibacillus sp. YPD9-1]